MKNKNNTFHDSFFGEGYQSVLKEEIERLALIERYINCKRSYEACVSLRDLNNAADAAAFTGHLAQFGHAYPEDYEKHQRKLEEDILMLGGWEL